MSQINADLNYMEGKLLSFKICANPFNPRYLRAIEQLWELKEFK